jgi:uncharacterized protein (TIGR01244 family)
MSSLVKRAGATAIALALFVAIGVAQSEPRYKELPNFHQVNEHLYRGAQPASGGLKKLSELGIKTIINLRGADEHTQAEQDEATAAGLQYFGVPMAALGRPTEEQVAHVLAIIDDQQNWPVFIHCKRGSDRTGTIIAAYRISHDDWTADHAIAEAKHYGMSWMEFGMKDYIADYYRDHQRASQAQASAHQ